VGVSAQMVFPVPVPDSNTRCVLCLMVSCMVVIISC